MPPAPQHFLYFLPLPQGHGSLRPSLMVWRGRGALENPGQITFEYCLRPPPMFELRLREAPLGQPQNRTLEDLLIQSITEPVGAATAHVVNL